MRVTITTSKPVYDLGERITINGTLTLGGNPVTNGLVAIQVNDPRNQSTVFRTLNTGIEPSKPWLIEILDFFPCDSSGSLRTSFIRGSAAGFRISLRNNALSDYYVIVPIYIQYSDDTPFTTFVIYEGIIEKGQTVDALTYPVPILANAPLGTSYAYANPIRDYPINTGYAYSPEKASTFQITASTSSTSTQDINVFTSTTSLGTYNATFKTSTFGGMLGNYMVYATSQYSYYLTTNQTTFTVILVGDITGRVLGVPDGKVDVKVDVKDVSMVARAFGSEPGEPNWNPIADITGPEYLVPDGKVDVRDVSIVRKKLREIWNPTITLVAVNKPAHP